MSDKRISLYSAKSDKSPEWKRQVAVEAALEIIKAEASGGKQTMYSDPSVNILSQYADHIQNALEKTDPKES